MTITIPTWVFWILGAPFAGMILFFAILGVIAIKAVPRWRGF